MPNSLRCMISKLKFQGKISELECEELLKKLDNHDKELIKEQTANWIRQYPHSKLLKCPVCGYEYSDLLECMNYCGNCGTEMEGIACGRMEGLEYGRNRK